MHAVPSTAFHGHTQPHEVLVVDVIEVQSKVGKEALALWLQNPKGVAEHCEARGVPQVPREA